MEDGSLNARVARARVRGVGRPSPRICCLPSLCVATAPPVAGMTWAGRLLLTFLLMLVVFGCSPGPARQDQKAIGEAVSLLEGNLEHFERMEDPEDSEMIDKSCAEIRRALRILQNHPEGPVLPTPYDCSVAVYDLPKDIPHRRICLQWIETGNEVTGFFLMFDDQTLEFSVLDPKSESMQELAAQTAARFRIVLVLDAHTEKAEDFEDIIPPYVSLPTDVLDRLFSRNRGPVSVGLLLSDGRRSSTCDLIGPEKTTKWDETKGK